MKFAFIFCFTLISLSVFGEKTDLIILRNGDRITGEIKELKHGKVKYSTDDVGVIYIEWEQVDQIYSKHNFELITITGTKYFGALSFGSPRTLKLISPAGFFELYLFEIINIIPIKFGFWNRIDGNINLGLNYTKASDLLQSNVELNLYYNTHNYNHRFQYTNLITVQSEKEDAIRQNALYNLTRLLDNKWLWQAGVNWEQNSELGILSRSSVTGQYGKFLLFNSKSALKVSAGLLLNTETSLEEVTTQNIESSISVSYDYFSFESPKLTVTSYYTLLPSLSTLGRVRQNFSTEIKWKIISDFTFSFQVYLNIDNQPITENASNEDYGFVTSIGYTF